MKGCVVPAHPFELTGARKLAERRQELTAAELGTLKERTAA